MDFAGADCDKPLGQIIKAMVGLPRPVFFGPRTLVRTWGTRPVPIGFGFADSKTTGNVKP